ncbi:MAG: hypothetical protein HETSPECPRED_005425 [Heterodermia speciosa]|uniref:Nonribosomal peptide synthetase 12 n=1 Tax=Heterodermia speciosa TaxID=116794 RepID=A0A8H3FG04_9LECA|nr:MAG: hypothetical protein HETSPECPRED_005425 [Heterodermia speciosa]
MEYIDYFVQSWAWDYLPNNPVVWFWSTAIEPENQAPGSPSAEGPPPAGDSTWDPPPMSRQPSLDHGTVAASMDEVKEPDPVLPTPPRRASGPPARYFRPENLDLARANSLGYPTEESYLEESDTSFSSYEDLEKGIAPILVQHQLGAKHVEVSDIPPIKKRPGHTVNLSYDSTWRISVPPKEVPALPSKKERRIWRRLRYTILAVYQRLFTIAFTANIIGLIIVLVRARNNHPSGPPSSALATATSVNVTVAIAMRQEYVINALYDICCLTPHSWPLRIRRLIAKLYEFGGVHSGCAISAVVWFILFAAFVTRDYSNNTFDALGVIIVTYILLFLFLAICLFSIPKFRFKSHNLFEAVHRFAGWLAVALFWVDILLVLNFQSKLPGSDSLGILVVKAPAFWFLLLITFLIVLPWTRLRKVDAFPEKLSNHAIQIHFKYRKMGPVLGIRITHNPMTEWHSFATIPSSDGSFSLIVSDAGDWTKKQIMQPANKYWIRGIPIAGVLRMAYVFKRIVVVTTGSGIGPVLSMLHSFPMPCRILWSTPNPQQTYGEKIMQQVASADPDAMIINTRASGRPDMVALAYHLFVESKAEAVFTISNPSLTRKVVYGMESRGIPAYGPVWDS